MLYGNNSISLIQAGVWGVFFQLFHHSGIQNQLYIFSICMFVWFAVKLGVDVMSLVDESQRKEVSWDRGITLFLWTLSFVTLKNSYCFNRRSLSRETYNNIRYPYSCPPICRSSILASTDENQNWEYLHPCPLLAKEGVRIMWHC